MTRSCAGRMLALAGLLGGVCGPVAAQELPSWLQKTTVNVLFFGDAFFIPEHHEATFDGESGVWLRRLFLTVDQKLTDEITARVRVEGNSPGDFTSNSDITPFLKDAYVRWTPGRHALTLGLAATPTFDAVEKSWGYRPVEKTLLDLQRIAGTRDFGISAQGSFDAAKRVRYNAQIGNGAGTRNETNKGKKASVALGFYPGGGWVLEVYGDFENRPNDTDRTTYRLFGGIEQKWGRVGVEAGRQARDTASGDSQDLDFASAWAVFALSEKWSLLVRADHMFDPNPEGDRIPYLPFATNADSTLIIFGLDYRVAKGLSLIPNVEYVTYGEAEVGSDPGDDVIARLTFAYQL